MELWISWIVYSPYESTLSPLEHIYEEEIVDEEDAPRLEFFNQTAMQ